LRALMVDTFINEEALRAKDCVQRASASGSARS
jgi:hypothetical protein